MNKFRTAGVFLGMKQLLLVGLAAGIFSAGIAAGEKPPIVILGVPQGATTTKVGGTYVTRTPDGKVFRTSELGGGWVTRGPSGETWRTTTLGSTAITRGPDGQTIRTTQLGSSYVSTGSDGSRTTTSPLGSTWISRSNTGETLRTSPLGSSCVTRPSVISRSSTTGPVLVLPRGGCAKEK